MIIKTYFILVLYLFISSINSQNRHNRIVIERKSLFCYVNPKYFAACKCFIRAVKGKQGIMSGFANLTKPVESIFVSVQLYYRYGTIYRPFFFGYKDIDACDFVANTNAFRYQNPISQKVYTLIKRADPRLVAGCPYTRLYWNYTAFDLNEVIGGLLPDIVPVGTYKVEINTTVDKNELFGRTIYTCVVKPAFDSRAMDFNMG